MATGARQHPSRRGAFSWCAAVAALAMLSLASGCAVTEPTPGPALEPEAKVSGKAGNLAVQSGKVGGLASVDIGTIAGAVLGGVFGSQIGSSSGLVSGDRGALPKVHYVWPEYSDDREYPSGYGAYTYVFMGNVAAPSSSATRSEYHRLAALLAALSALPRSDSPSFGALIASGFSTSEINLFVVPVRAPHAQASSLSVETFDFERSTVIYAAMRRLVERSGEPGFASSLGARPGPFLMTVSAQILGADAPTMEQPASLIADLSEMHPDAAIEVVRRFREVLEKEPLQSVRGFDPIALRFLYALLAVDDSLSLVRPALADWVDFGRKLEQD